MSLDAIPSNAHPVSGNTFLAAAHYGYGRKSKRKSEKMTDDWVWVPLDDTYCGRPRCSEEGCSRRATEWLGKYIEAGVDQGEGSQVKGWFFCFIHFGKFEEKMRACD